MEGEEGLVVRRTMVNQARSSSASYKTVRSRKRVAHSSLKNINIKKGSGGAKRRMVRLGCEANIEEIEEAEAWARGALVGGSRLHVLVSLQRGGAPARRAS